MSEESLSIQAISAVPLAPPTLKKMFDDHPDRRRTGYRNRRRRYSILACTAELVTEI